MIMLKVLRLSRISTNYFQNNISQPIHRLIGTSYNLCGGKSNHNSDIPPPIVFSKYEPFRDDRASVILDVEEERRKLSDGAIIQEDDDESKFQGISPERGVEGVIDVEELVEILRGEKAQDLFVVEVPAEYRYVRYMVIVSGSSSRHMLGMVEFVRRVYKFKNANEEVIPKIEGKGSRDWIALDLGNIALHVFSKRKREEYDLESLWALGCDYDKLSNQPDDPIIKLLKEHSVLLNTSNTTN